MLKVTRTENMLYFTLLKLFEQRYCNKYRDTFQREKKKENWM